MRTVISHFGTKKQLKDTGKLAMVSYTNDEGKEIYTTIDKAVPCRVLNALPVPQDPAVRWDHNEKSKKGELTSRQQHGKLQPSWTAKAFIQDGQLVIH